MSDLKGRWTDNKGRLVARLNPWSLGPSAGLPAPGLGPGPDPAWDQAQGSPGLGPRLQGLGPAANRPLLSANRPLMSLLRPLMSLNRPLLSPVRPLMSLNRPSFRNKGR